MAIHLKLKIILIAISSTFFLFSNSFCQSGLDLLKLDYLFVGAHPDDEGGFTGTMARYNLDEGFKGSVTNFTLGEGGGNAIGPEVGASLGLIRFEEMRKSLAMAGVDRFFYLGFEDFYFTQSADLTHKIWSEQNPEYFCELMRVVRITRPEVIVTMWPGPGTHGHHQMAARSAIRAFNLAADPETCPGLIVNEYLEPWQPLKLYISAPQGRYSLEVPTDEFSRSVNMMYADLKSIALRNFRTQGWDRWNTVPAQRRSPERRLLVKSLVPVGEPEQHFLEGTHLAAGASPPGVLLTVETENYKVNSGEPFEVQVQFKNKTDRVYEKVVLGIQPPEGWMAETAQNAPVNLNPGEKIESVFEMSPSNSIIENEQQQIWVFYEAVSEGNEIKGKNYTWIEPSPPIHVQIKPLFDIAQYRDFAKETSTEWLAPNLPTRLPLYQDQQNEVTVQLYNDGDSVKNGNVSFDLPDGVIVDGDLSYTVHPGETEEMHLTMIFSETALPSDRQSVLKEAKVITSTGTFTVSEDINLYLLPSMGIQKAETPPEIDGDLSDMTQYSRGKIHHTDLWSGNTTGSDDSSADFYLAYDSEHLYASIRVYDDDVLCHMPSNRIRNHWYGDAIELTIDPAGLSTDVSTTFRVSIFPCSTDGFEPNAARYGDANSGAITQTAPGMNVASVKKDNGYVIEAAIPWSAMPEQPQPGDSLRLNILVYDADQENPDTGADYGKSRIGWGSVVGAQQATTYLWPLVILDHN